MDIRYCWHRLDRLTWGDGLKLRPMALEAMLQWRSGLGMLVTRPSVRPHQIRRTALRIFTKLGMKLKDDKVRKVTRPDFLGKILIIQ